MAKYSKSFKLRLVKECLENSLGYHLLAQKYGLPSFSPIVRWVKAYEVFGEEGLRKKQKKQVYSVQFKMDVLHFVKRTAASYQDTAIHFKMKNPSAHCQLEPQIFGERSRKPGRMSERMVLHIPKNET